MESQSLQRLQLNPVYCPPSHLHFAANQALSLNEAKTWTDDYMKRHCRYHWDLTAAVKHPKFKVRVQDHPDSNGQVVVFDHLLKVHPKPPHTYTCIQLAYVVGNALQQRFRKQGLHVYLVKGLSPQYFNNKDRAQHYYLVVSQKPLATDSEQAVKEISNNHCLIIDPSFKVSCPPDLKDPKTQRNYIANQIEYRFTEKIPSDYFQKEVSPNPMEFTIYDYPDGSQETICNTLGYLRDFPSLQQKIKAPADSLLHFSIQKKAPHSANPYYVVNLHLMDENGEFLESPDKNLVPKTSVLGQFIQKVETDLNQPQVH